MNTRAKYDRYYKQGFGSSGPSGVHELRGEETTEDYKAWSIDSYLFTGLIAPQDETMVISCFDNSKYLHRSTVYNRLHRNGIADRNVDSERFFFETGFALEGIQNNGDTIRLPAIYIRKGYQPYAVFEEQARAMADSNTIVLNESPRSVVSIKIEDNDHIAFNRESIVELVSPQEDQLVILEIESFNQTENTQQGAYLKSRFNELKAKGYPIGISLSPLLILKSSALFLNKPEWILRDAYGDMIKFEHEDGIQFYILDTSNPETFDYLKSVFNELAGIGFSYFQTTNMDAGLVDSKHVKRYMPGKTSLEYFNAILKMIREEIGFNTYWSSTATPYQPLLGFVDGVTVSYSNTIEDQATEMYASEFFNNVLWQNQTNECCS